jgi:ribonuclease G
LIKELIIDSTPNGATIALLQDKQLVELHKEQVSNNYTVGDIYLGRIKKIMPSLNAAFVDVGYEKDAFLHYLDLGPQVQSLLKLAKQVRSGGYQSKLLDNFKLEADINKGGKISEVLTKNQLIPVQIAKEPISTKGPRLSADLSIAGRYVVLVPFSEVISISKKIKSNTERTRLRKVVESIKPAHFGVIIRTVSENKGVAELQKDLLDLISKWETFITRLPSVEPAKKVLGEIGRTSTILRDLLNADFQSITVNDNAMYEEVKSYIHEISPDLEGIVKLHKHKDPIFENLGVDKQIKGAFGKTVNLAGGAYLVIEHTEALHVIDVNSGNRTASKENQEENAYQVNKEAAKEIARQLRLRDMGGIVVIDFIDMHKPQNRKELFDYLRAEMAHDRAKHTILPPSKFGLVQVTRQRVRPEMNIVTSELCPACGGTGTIRPTILLIDDIETNFNYILDEQNEKNITLCVHPYIEAYIQQGFIFTSKQWKWYFKYHQWIKVKSNPAYQITEFHFFSSKDEEIKL